MSFDEIVGQALQFLHTAADAIGYLCYSGIRMILPSIMLPESLISTIGLLAVVSLLLGFAEVAKKAVWIIVLVGWLLIVVRLVLIGLRSV